MVSFRIWDWDCSANQNLVQMPWNWEQRDSFAQRTKTGISHTSSNLTSSSTALMPRINSTSVNTLAPWKWWDDFIMLDSRTNRFLNSMHKCLRLADIILEPVILATVRRWKLCWNLLRRRIFLLGCKLWTSVKQAARRLWKECTRGMWDIDSHSPISTRCLARGRELHRCYVVFKDSRTEEAPTEIGYISSREGMVRRRDSEP